MPKLATGKQNLLVGLRWTRQPLRQPSRSLKKQRAELRSGCAFVRSDERRREPELKLDSRARRPCHFQIEPVPAPFAISSLRKILLICLFKTTLVLKIKRSLRRESKLWRQ